MGTESTALPLLTAIARSFTAAMEAETRLDVLAAIAHAAAGNARAIALCIAGDDDITAPRPKLSLVPAVTAHNHVGAEFGGEA